MEDAGDFQIVSFVAKENTVVLGAETQHGWICSPKLLGIPLTAVRVASQRFEYL